MCARTCFTVGITMLHSQVHTLVKRPSLSSDLRSIDDDVL